MTTTVSRWIDLPTTAPTALATDEPLGAGTLQVAASTANFGTQVNNLRVLWEHPGPGSDEILGDLGYDANPDAFPWNTDPSGATRVFVAFAGVHRIRTYGETGSYPKLVLKALLSTTATTAGIIMVARPTMGCPAAGDLYGTFTTTSATLTAASITLPLIPGAVGFQPFAPTLGTAYPIPEPVEQGGFTQVAIYVGAWRTGAAGASKGTVAGITVYLEAP